MPLQHFITGAGLSTIAFAMYIQFHPKMGNIWIRNGEFQPRQLLHFMTDPFSDTVLWKPEFLDLNWPVIATTGGLVAHFLNNNK